MIFFGAAGALVDALATGSSGALKLAQRSSTAAFVSLRSTAPHQLGGTRAPAHRDAHRLDGRRVDLGLLTRPLRLRVVRVRVVRASDKVLVLVVTRDQVGGGKSGRHLILDGSALTCARTAFCDRESEVGRLGPVLEASTTATFFCALLRKKPTL